MLIYANTVPALLWTGMGQNTWLRKKETTFLFGATAIGGNARKCAPRIASAVDASEMKRIFDELDTNNNGAVDPGEFDSQLQ